MKFLEIIFLGLILYLITIYTKKIVFLLELRLKKQNFNQNYEIYVFLEVEHDKNIKKFDVFFLQFSKNICLFWQNRYNTIFFLFQLSKWGICSFKALNFLKASS